MVQNTLNVRNILYFNIYIQCTKHKGGAIEHFFSILENGHIAADQVYF